MAYSSDSVYTGQPVDDPRARIQDDPVQWIRDRWDDFAALYPRILDLQHRAAEAAQAARAAGSDRLAELAKDVIRRLGDLAQTHDRVVHNVQQYGQYVGLSGYGDDCGCGCGGRCRDGLGAVPAAAVAALTGLALVMLWVFRTFAAEERKLQLIEDGILTPEQAAELDTGPRPESVLDQVAGIGRWIAFGLLALLAWEAYKRTRPLLNPPLVIRSNPPERFGDHVHALYYQHTEDGQYYRHDFEPGVELIALDDGDVLLRHPSKPVWGDFEVSH